MILTEKKAIFFLLCIFLITQPVDLRTKRKKPGYPYFKKAYDLEKLYPDQAIALYHQALYKGLEV